VTDNPRLLAVRALTDVYRRGLTLDQVLPVDTSPLVRELVTGTLRHHFSLSQHVDELLTKALRSKDTDVRALLLLGAYQLLHMRIPDHASVAETVACTKAIKKPWAKGLVNAVLRKLAAGRSNADTKAVQADWPAAARQDHPQWFIEALRDSAPEHSSQILTANNSRAPMTLRVNQAKITPTDYAELLDKAGIAFRAGALPETLHLQEPRKQTSLPGFADGLVAVQDGAAQLAAAFAVACLTDSRQQQTAARPLEVLDACAAPGGKGFHLLERTQATGVDVALTMQDIAQGRVDTLREQATRLGHAQHPALTINAADSSKAAPRATYDLILLDAPCSGSGTVRRHPDIKVLRQKQDITALNDTQLALLSAQSTQLRPGGWLIYCTCSLFREENDAIIRAFLRRFERSDGTHAATQSAGSPANSLGASQHQPRVSPLLPRLVERFCGHALTPGIRTEFGWQTLPTIDGGDGLYYCVLEF